MTHPESLYEEASYELNKFRERRMTDRRFKPRDTADRRVTTLQWPPLQDPESEKKPAQ